MSNEMNLFKYIFNDDTKYTILNHAQISVTAFIPFVLLSKIIDFLPEPNDKKGVLELSFEIILQIVILIVGIVIIVKFASYFKPLTGSPFPEDLGFAPFILACLYISISFQSSMSEKLQIIKDKIANKFYPEKTITQPVQTHSLTRQLQIPPPQPTQLSPQLPTQLPTQPQQNQLPSQTQTQPNYNQMYQNQPIDTFEPTAANEMYSGIGTNF